MLAISKAPTLDLGFSQHSNAKVDCTTRGGVRHDPHRAATSRGYIPISIHKTSYQLMPKQVCEIRAAGKWRQYKIELYSYPQWTHQCNAHYKIQWIPLYRTHAGVKLHDGYVGWGSEIYFSVTNYYGIVRVAWIHTTLNQSLIILKSRCRKIYPG